MPVISTTNVTNPTANDFVALVTPTSMSVGVMDLSKAERNANGKMIIERIATKQKLELSYSFLTKQQMATVLTAVSYVKFWVKYTDPQTDTIRQAQFYCGDRNTGILDFVNGVPRYIDVKFNLIEL